MKTVHYVLGVLVLLALVGAGVILFSPESNEQPAGNTGANVASSQGNETHTVTITDDGFEPENLTIQQGDTVEFSTERDKPFWPASNLHPTHTINPEFDPKEPVQPDSTWSHTFTKKGEWGMHDHLAPYFTGEIIVE